MKKPTSSIRLLFCFLLLGSLSFSSGCGSDGNTVVEPAGSTPTAEDEAAYQKEIEEQKAER